MLRAKSFKKALCLLLVLLLAFIPSVNSRAEGDDVLYFGALDESIAQNPDNAVKAKRHVHELFRDKYEMLNIGEDEEGRPVDLSE